MDAFFDLLIHTFEEVREHEPKVHPLDLAQYMAVFRRFRASYNLFWQGYYFDGAALLRSVFESVLYLGAVQNGYIKKSDIFYSSDEEDLDPVLYWNKHYNKTKKTEKTILRYMYGDKSELDQNNQELLRIGMSLLHKHVHRSATTMWSIFGRLVIDKKPVAMFPKVNVEDANHYVTTSTLQAWCFVRLLPYLSTPNLFSKEWGIRHDVLDDSFEEWFKEVKEPIARAIEQFVQMKFNFVETSKTNTE